MSARTLEAPAQLPEPRNCGHILRDCAELRDSRDALHDLPELRRRMAAEGYLYLPELLDRQQVLDARREVLTRLQDAGHLDPRRDLMDGVIRPGVKPGFIPDVLARNNQSLLRVVYNGAMMDFWRRFFGGEVRHFDYTWFRSIAPGSGSPSHCDVVYMGRGTPNLYTAWTPIGDVDTQLGGLMMLEGSNNHQRLRQTYCRMDVDAHCGNRSGPAALDAWQKGTNGSLNHDPNQVQRSLGGRWLTSPHYRAGDVVLFSVFTVHAGLDNQTPDRIRLSSDTRYQPANEPADQRWIGPNPPAHGPQGKRTLIC